MCTAQLSVSVPFSSENDTPAVSPRVTVSDLTEPESFGQPLPENTILVMRGESGGAAKQSAGSARKKSDERIMLLMIFERRLVSVRKQWVLVIIELPDLSARLFLYTPGYEVGLAQDRPRQSADPGPPETRSPKSPYSTLTSI
jgi:hypothetical protein